MKLKFNKNMKNKTITILLIIAIIAIAFIATKIKKQTIIINDNAPTIEVRILDKWCDETPEIYECRTHKANKKEDR